MLGPADHHAVSQRPRILLHALLHELDELFFDVEQSFACVHAVQIEFFDIEVVVLKQLVHVVRRQLDVVVGR